MFHKLFQRKMKEQNFSARVTEIAHELSELVQEHNKDGKQCAVIILSSERIDDETSKNNIGTFGHGGQIRNVLHDFASQPKTKGIFMDVAKIVAIENIIKS